MDIMTGIGLVSGIIVVAIMVFMGGDLHMFISEHAMIIIFGGSIAATMIRFPLSAILHGLRRTLAGRTELTPSVRQALIGAVQAIQAVGATGRIAFDEFGDTTARVLTVYRATGGTWQPERTAELR